MSLLSWPGGRIPRSNPKHGNALVPPYTVLLGRFQLKCSMGRMECYKRDAYHVGKHSRPTPRLAHVIFYLFTVSIYLIY